MLYGKYDPMLIRKLPFRNSLKKLNFFLSEPTSIGNRYVPAKTKVKKMDSYILKQFLRFLRGAWVGTLLLLSYQQSIGGYFATSEDIEKYPDFQSPQMNSQKLQNYNNFYASFITITVKSNDRKSRP